MEESFKAIAIAWIMLFVLNFVVGLFGIHGSRSATPYGDAGCYYSDCY